MYFFSFIKTTFALVVGVIGGQALAATPAHYIVFDREVDGTAVPVFHAIVEIDLPEVSPNEPVVPLRSRTNEEWIQYRTEAGIERTILVNRVVRAEFVGEHSDHHGADDQAVLPDADLDFQFPDHSSSEDHFHSHFVPDPGPQPFVLRVPVSEGNSLTLVTGHQVQEIDLYDLAARSTTLPLDSYGPNRADDGRSQRIDFPGPPPTRPSNRIDILVLGEGYRVDQKSSFQDHALAIHATFNNLSPYGDYANLFNWHGGFLASEQAGADHPPYVPGCTSSTCCADPAALGDPYAGQFVDTAFDASYCANNIHRLMWVNTSKLLAYAAHWPDWDQILLSVNDPVHGGAGGGPISIASRHPSSMFTMMHEMGHTISNLADEYTASYPGFWVCSDVDPSGFGCEPNVTDAAPPHPVKWAPLYTPGNPIPTPPAYSGVGLFQGARYRPVGMYRPTNNQCLMRRNVLTFCPVCKQAFVIRVYRGGFGFTPAGGVRLIEPGTVVPESSRINMAVGTTQRFQAEILVPTNSSVSIQWYLDNEPIIGANTGQLDFTVDTLLPSLRSLRLEVTDLTGLVHPELSQGALVHKRGWTITVNDEFLFADGFEGMP